MPKNTIITTYRNRKDNLSLYLRSLQHAHKKSKSKDYEIVIVDLGSSDGSFVLKEEYVKKLNLKWFNVKYDGVFWKTKAINYAVKRTDSELITLVDTDSIFQNNFLQSIEDFFTEYPNSRKLAHRVRFLNHQFTNLMKKKRGLIKENDILFIMQNYRSFNFARERYFSNGIIFYENIVDKTKEVLENALGNSHCTIFRKDFLDIGGMDERFIGHGLEDLDFNNRLYKHIKSGSLRNSPLYDIFHMEHQYEKNWSTEENRETNRKIYKENVEKNVLKIENDNFGEF